MNNVFYLYDAGLERGGKSKGVYTAFYNSLSNIFICKVVVTFRLRGRGRRDSSIMLVACLLLIAIAYSNKDKVARKAISYDTR